MNQRENVVNTDAPESAWQHRGNIVAPPALRRDVSLSS
jgi:hypothetical protein